jgi:hypothetical protein
MAAYAADGCLVGTCLTSALQPPGATGICTSSRGPRIIEGLRLRGPLSVDAGARG